MMSNPSPYGQPYSQNTGQQIGASSLGPQMQNKAGLQNSLPQFPMDKKPVPGAGMPNMVSRMKNVSSKCCSSVQCSDVALLKVFQLRMHALNQHAMHFNS